MKNIFISTAILCISLTSAAAITVHTLPLPFEEASSERVTDTFDDLNCTDVLFSPLVRTAGAFTYQAVSANDFYNSCELPGASLSANDALSPITIDNFTGDVSAVGGWFWATDIAGIGIAGGSLLITVTDSSGAQVQHTTTTNPADVFAFAAFTSDSLITSITVQTVPPSATIYHWTTMDGFTLGKTIQ